VAAIGTIILVFGWFAFNAGSTKNAPTSHRSSLQIPDRGRIDGLSAMFYCGFKYGKPILR
jgi:Amt family ammonium transporter